MFGDVGHGILMGMMSGYLIVKEKKFLNVEDGMFKTIFDGRYMIFMMSLFSIYTGMLYNEFVSEIESGESE
jgi:V-type H+-transporting ATPase subunit a